MSYEIDNRVKFLVLYECVTQSLNQISKLSGVPLSTCSRYQKKIFNDEDIFETSVGRGRKRKLDPEDVDELVRFVRKNPGKSSTRKLGPRFGVGKDTIHQTLIEEGFDFKLVKRKANPSKEVMKERLQFCKDLKNDESLIYDAFYADEMGICLEDMYKHRIWTEEENPTLTDPINRQRLNVWAAISSNGATKLEIYDDNLDADSYLKILKKHKKEMEDIAQDSVIIFHDKHPAHRAKVIETYVNKTDLDLIELPTGSCDLNPIENIWGWAKNKIREDHPNYLEELKKSLRKNWKQVTPDFLSNYFESMHDRVSMCIESKGAYTGY